jgi:ApeA N-terminal domain 1
MVGRLGNHVNSPEPADDESQAAPAPAVPALGLPTRRGPQFVGSRCRQGINLCLLDTGCLEPLVGTTFLFLQRGGWQAILRQPTRAHLSGRRRRLGMTDRTSSRIGGQLAESALEVKTAPDTYRCTWTLSKPPEEEIWQSEGDVTLLGDRQPAGAVYGRAPINVVRTPGGYTAGFPQTFEYPVVYGKLINGRDVILVDAMLKVWADRSSGFFSGANAHFDAWVALVGHGVPTTPDVLVDSGVVQITHLDAFAARCPIEEIGDPGNPYENDEPYRVKFRKDSCQEWSDDAAKVSIEYFISADIGLTGYHFSVAFSPAVRIELKTPVPVKDFFTSWVLPLHGLVSAATGQNEDITYWSCSPIIDGDDDPPARRQFQAFVRWVNQEPYASENTIPDKRVSSIRLAEGDSLLHLLRRWQYLEDEQNPILNTYDVHSLGPDQAPRARFLLLVQALEGLCGHEGRLSGRWAKFEAKRARILDGCRESLTAKDFEYLDRRLPKTPYNLDDALREMLETLPTNLEPELAQSKLVKTVLAQVDEVTTTVEALRHVRHKLSHGVETFDPHDLHVVAGILGRAVRGHLLRLVEASEAAQERVLAPPDR